MNKSIKTVLILSIAANAVLFAGFATGYISFKKTSAKVVPPAATRALSPEAARETKALLLGDDMAALRDQLRALGLPEDIVKEIVKARIANRSAARMWEIHNAAREAARQRPYWRGERFNTLFLGTYTSAQWKEMMEIYDERGKESRQLFGPDKADEYVSSSYAFLPHEKAVQLDKMGSDYSKLRRQVIDEMAGFRMPDDEAKLKLIDEEKKRDIIALLTPEEREANELRNSETAQQLQRTLAGFITTEEEYKAIFALQSALEEKYPNNVSWETRYYGGADKSEYDRARAEEQKNIDAQIKDMLGEERYADYLRGQRQDYQSLMAAAERFNLSAEAVVQTYQLRDDAAREAERISDDAGLSTAQKNEAYAALAEQATAQIKAALGEDVGAAYIDNSLQWLKNLPKGGSVKIGPKGNVNVTQPKGRGKGR